jgi:hypothetical protein
MSSYSSYGRASRNENGNEEVNIEYSRTFWQWLFRRPGTVEVYERHPDGVHWYSKEAGRRCSARKEDEIYYVLRSIKYNGFS